MLTTTRPTKLDNTNSRQTPDFRFSALATGVALSLGLVASAQAFQVDTGNRDIEIAWDNTLRYNLGVRAENIGQVGNSSISDEGEHFADKGDIVTNRVDVLTEFDFIYKGNYGFRVSAAGWYDHAYRDAESTRNPDLNAPGSYEDDEYSSYTERFYKGPSGEILDAFTFGRFYIGEMPLTVKAGQHTVYWGESLSLGAAINGIAYSQSPLDLIKGFATPGAGAKELFLPLNQVSTQLIATDTVSIAANYYFDWEPTRIPEGGTYLGPADFVAYGPDGLIPGTVNNEGIKEPDSTGDWGVQTLWRPGWLDGTLGFYYRNFTDKIPAFFLIGSDYRSYFGEDIDLFGVSLSKQVGDMSLGAEVSYRNNMPLAARTLGQVAFDPTLHPNGAPELIDNSFQARGKTLHGSASLLGLLPKSPLWDSGTFRVEAIYARLQSVDENEDMYHGVGHGTCDESRRNELGANFRDEGDQCATDDMWAVSVTAEPTWLQVFSGVNLSMPMAYSQTIEGNAPTQLGGNEGNGNYSIGVSADFYSKYTVDLKYVDYFGDVKRSQNANGDTAITGANGLSTLLRDRGWVGLTAKATF
ncbi:DUF1302 domain-containing protein [Marinobacter sp. GN3S48]|uniref:DUF1302 domain-containing protein n=1 Tax=Marinobacter sp. GN3S48 TaxID=3382302 RepID=UPI00387AD93E